MLFTVIAASGCIQADSTTDGATPVDSKIARPELGTASYEDCVATGVVMVVSKVRLNDYLPTGYEAEDATLALGLLLQRDPGIDSGQGFLMLATFDCQDADNESVFKFGGPLIGIKNPGTHSANFADATYHLFAPEAYISGHGAPLPLMRDFWLGVEADIHTSIGNGVMAPVEATIATDRLVYQYHSEELTDSTLTAELAIYQQSRAGTLLMQVAIPQLTLTAQSECQFDEGTAAAIMTGGNNCDAVLVAGYEEYDAFSVRYDWAEGTFASRS